jgi:aryl-phospho-beta-D-glucosidase BglC (GH1 family)
VKPELIGPGWLHTEGTRIVNDQGREVRFTGVGLQTLQGLGIEGHAYDVPDDRHFDNILRFGFNQVRLPIRWLFIEPHPPTLNPDGTITHHFDQRYLQAMDAVIRELGERGIKVVISMNAVPGTGGELDNHEPVHHIWAMPAWLYPHRYPSIQEARCGFFANRTQPGVPLPSIQDGLADVWRMVAARYANNSTVIGADILNEPYLPTGMGCEDPGLNLWSALTRIGFAIQAANPRLLLVVEDGGRPNEGRNSLPAPPPLANMVYSFHLYAQELKQGMRKYNAFLEQSRAWNVPLYMGEFNAFWGSTQYPGPNWRLDTLDLLGMLDRDGVSWSAWAYCCGANSLYLPRSPHLKPKLLPTLQEGFD